jgi:hypothetical protein
VDADIVLRDIRPCCRNTKGARHPKGTATEMPTAPERLTPDAPFGGGPVHRRSGHGPDAEIDFTASVPDLSRFAEQVMDRSSWQAPCADA